MESLLSDSDKSLSELDSYGSLLGLPLDLRYFNGLPTTFRDDLLVERCMPEAEETSCGDFGDFLEYAIPESSKLSSYLVDLEKLVFLACEEGSYISVGRGCLVGHESGTEYLSGIRKHGLTSLYGVPLMFPNSRQRTG